jgi:hypothetical protein
MQYQPSPGEKVAERVEFSQSYLEYCKALPVLERLLLRSAWLIQ